VIDTTTDMVIGSAIAVGVGPFGIAVNPAGTRAYVANQFSNSVSLIDTTTNMVIGSAITVGTNPRGIAIGPAPPPPVYEVPTLSEWAMILLVLSLAGVGMVMVRRRQAL
jgi:YVTN family beta-propeller protein